MKRILLSIAFLITVSLTSMMADVKVRKDGKILLVEFHMPQSTDLYNEGSLSMDYILSDMKGALETASAQKCNTIVIYDNNGQIMKIIKGKERINDIQGTLGMMKGYIEDMAHTETIPGKIIGVSNRKTGNARYRQETYINGQLQSSYETEWTQGPFETKSSMYKSGNDIITTKTFYLPPSYETIMNREPGTTVEIDGPTEFVKKAYRQ